MSKTVKAEQPVRYSRSGPLGLRIREWHGKVYQPRQEDAAYFASSEWRRLKQQVFNRDDHRCQRCQKQYRISRPLGAHHIIPRQAGGPDEMENLITLCHPCHNHVEDCPELDTASKIRSDYWEQMSAGAVMKLDTISDGEKPDWHAWVYGGQRRPSW